MCLFFCFWRPISLSLNTGSLLPRGCAPLTPGCILAPFQGALFRYRSIQAFGALFRYRSIWAFGALFRYRSIRAFGALFRPLGSIRAFGYAIAPFGAIRSAYRPISPFGLNTGSLSSRGCAPLTPGCILAPFQGALFPHCQIVTSAVDRYQNYRIYFFR